MSGNLERALEALHHIPADCSRDDWVRVGMGAKAVGLSLDDFLQWSASARSFCDRDARDTWRSIKPNKGVGAGTLFHMAKKHGWQSHTTWQTRPPSRSRPSRLSPKPRLVHQAAEVWARCVPATATHPYVTAKQAHGAPLEDVRVVPDGDPLQIMGQSMDGALVLPCRREDGSISSLQFVTVGATAEQLKAMSRATKPNLPGHRLEGWHTVGKPMPGAEVFVCEGIGTAWVCWLATGNTAVVSFGWTRVRAVTQALRQRDATARLVLVPDVGKELEAYAIARDTGSLVAAMPPGWRPNADVADLAHTEGLEVVRELLIAPKAPEYEPHPLAKFVVLDEAVRPPKWLVPGFIEEGVLTIAGEPAVGKTTILVPLAACVAHLCDEYNPLRPRHWRHVIYITEDSSQVQRILFGLRDYGTPRLDAKLVHERFHLVEATRLSPDEMVRVGVQYRQRFARWVGGVELLPLVVLDTRAAVLALDDENDNSEASKAVAALRQRFEGLSTWVIGHPPKNLSGRGDARTLSMRGAGAWVGDVRATAFVVRENGQRFIVLGKRRFESRWEELAVESFVQDVVVPDEFGEEVTLKLRWGIPTPPKLSRQKVQEVAAEAAREKAEAELRHAVRDAVQLAWRSGFPLNREGIKAKVKRKAAEVTRIVEGLLAERWLVEVPIPSLVRSNPKRASFFVNLTIEEHSAVLQGEPVPAAKLEIPLSMRKAEA